MVACGSPFLWLCTVVHGEPVYLSLAVRSRLRRRMAGCSLLYFLETVQVPYEELVLPFVFVRAV